MKHQRGSHTGPRRVLALATAVTAAASMLLVGGVPVAQAFDPAVEADNFSKTQERQTIYTTPEYQVLLRQVSAQNRAEADQMQAADPERNFRGHLCATGEDGCAGDARLYEWEANGYGIVQKVLFTARSGATISGRVWATRAGPAKRPGIVITNGSIQAPERLYWFVAQTLAKAGYIVLTSDPQGQGQSDEKGEPPDENEGSPAQTDGRPFYDGTEDALNFFLSTPENPYEPVPSCDSGTSHAAKQDRRVAAGLNAAYNPIWRKLDASRIGLAGHSFGAAGVSFVGQKDPRVSAIVAWDNLGPPNASRVEPCPADPASHDPVPITKPALGMSADYGLTPTPFTSDPNPHAKSTQSLAYTQAGVDTGQLIFRGGTHYEWSFLPDPAFGATLRGADMAAWYTTAWFDRYVKGDASSDKRLLTNRWRSDAQEAAIDPNNDGNMFSFYYRSRLDIGLAGGGRFGCEDIRPGCPGMVSDDGWSGDYSYIDIVTSLDPPAADLSLTISDAPDPVGAGEPLTYTVTVTNTGFDTARGVSVTDTLDRKVRLRSARASQGRCTVRRTQIGCDLGDLAEGDSATVTIVVRPTRKGTIANTASASAVEPADPDTTNNTATETTTVKP